MTDQGVLTQVNETDDTKSNVSKAQRRQDRGNRVINVKRVLTYSLKAFASAGAPMRGSCTAYCVDCSMHVDVYWDVSCPRGPFPREICPEGQLSRRRGIISKGYEGVVPKE